MHSADQQLDSQAASPRAYARPGGYRELLRVAWPLVLSTASHTVMHFTDRVMLTRYSEATAAAATCAGVLSFALLSFVLGISFYTGTFVAQYYGAQDRRMCVASVWQGVYFSVVAGMLAPLVIIPLGSALLRGIGHEPAVLAAELTYFRILSWGALPALLGNAVASFFSGRGDTWTVMWVNAGGAAVNVGLNYILIFGHAGAPRLGIAGAGIATVTASALGMLAYIALFSRAPMRRAYGTWTHTALRPATLWRLIRYGGPSGLSFSLDISAFALFTLLVGKLGTIPLIASNIALAINTLAFFPMLGMSMATSILVGQHIGRGKPDDAARSAYSGVLLALGYMTFCGLIFVLLPRTLFTLFQGGGIAPDVFEHVVSYGRTLMIMVAILGVFDAPNTTFSGALKGSGDTWFAMWMNVLLAWVIFIPPVWYFTVVSPRGMYWAWSCLVLYVVLLGAVYWWRFARGRWRAIQIREQPAPAVVPDTSGEAVLV